SPPSRPPMRPSAPSAFPFYTDPAPPRLRALSLHDALPIWGGTFDLTAFSDMAPTVAALAAFADEPVAVTGVGFIRGKESDRIARSEEHTSELQSRENLVCRLLLEKKKR